VLTYLSKTAKPLIKHSCLSYEFIGVSPNEYHKKGSFLGAVPFLISQCGWKRKMVGHTSWLVPDLGKPETTTILSDLTPLNY
jgi:hypothetical protein